MVVVGGDVSTEGGTKEGAVITDERDGGVWVGMKLEKAPSVGVSAPSVGVSAPSVGVSAPSGGVSRRRRRAHTPRRVVPIQNTPRRPVEKAPQWGCREAMEGEG